MFHQYHDKAIGRLYLKMELRISSCREGEVIALANKILLYLILRYIDLIEV